MGGASLLDPETGAPFKLLPAERDFLQHAFQTDSPASSSPLQRSPPMPMADLKVTAEHLKRDAYLYVRQSTSSNTARVRSANTNCLASGITLNDLPRKLTVTTDIMLASRLMYTVSRLTPRLGGARSSCKNIRGTQSKTNLSPTLMSLISSTQIG
jgi:hypothetical protein